MFRDAEELAVGSASRKGNRLNHPISHRDAEIQTVISASWQPLAWGTDITGAKDLPGGIIGRQAS